MSRPPTAPTSCTAMRHVLVKRGSLNMLTGEAGPINAGAWETQRCGVPLFGVQREFGRCRACYQDPGWTMDGNRPATVAEVQAYTAAGGP